MLCVATRRDKRALYSVLGENSALLVLDPRGINSSGWAKGGRRIQHASYLPGGRANQAGDHWRRVRARESVCVRVWTR